MNTVIKDALDRIGSTIIQAGAGAAVALTAAGGLGTLAEWRTAALTAASAGVLAAAKVLGVNAARASSTSVQGGGQLADEVLTKLAAKLK